jgi:YebC/PmpR family DNA-binding regulatory protein
MANKKAATALQKGKVYGMHSKLISLAARGGANPLENPTLYTAIEKAKKDSVPKDVIEKAIRRGAGLDKDAAAIEDITYEGTGAGGIAIIVRALTDNRNRTASSFRSYFNKNGGNLGETGSLSNHMFKYRGVFVVPSTAITEDQIIESGCDDYVVDGDETRLMCLREQFSDVTNFLKSAGIEVSSSGFEYLPTLEIEVTDFEQGVKVMKLLQDLDADDDVEKCWTNGVFDDILREKIESFLDSNGFRS